MKSFAHYGGSEAAKQYAKKLVPELAKGSTVTTLTPGQARDAIAALGSTASTSHNHRAASSAKSRDHHRAAIRQFLAWAVRRDYLSPTHRLAEADGLRPEHANTAENGIYTAKELASLLNTADDTRVPGRPAVSAPRRRSAGPSKNFQSAARTAARCWSRPVPDRQSNRAHISQNPGQYGCQVRPSIRRDEDYVALPEVTRLEQFHDISHSFIAGRQSATEESGLDMLLVVEVASLVRVAAAHDFASLALRQADFAEWRMSLLADAAALSRSHALLHAPVPPQPMLSQLALRQGLLDRGGDMLPDSKNP